MKIYCKAVLCGLAAMGLMGCSEENPWQHAKGEGGITLRLSTDSDVKDAIPLVRGTESLLQVPDVSEFSVGLENVASGEKRTWSSIADFENAGSFAAGGYTLTAFYGSLEEEGFEKPYFYGEAQVTVVEGRNADVNVTASLANSMISIDYTDAFKTYFSDYSATVHSEGHSYVEFSASEIRPAYVAPGNVSLAINVTNPSGQSVTLQPANFPAAARHHYHITFDVNNGNVGQAQLQIIFDDSVTQEDVEIDLTEELFTTPAPTITTTGFSDGGMINTLSGNASDTPLKFNIIARGGIASAKLTFTGDSYNPPCGREVELIGASAALQQQLADMGISALGLFKNPSTMATLDVTALPGRLPEGEVGVTLEVKDPYTRVSAPVSVNFTSEAVALELEPGTALYSNNTATVQVTYNGAEPEKNISFKALNKAGIYQDAPVVSVEESTRTRNFESKVYNFTITLPDTEREEIPVQCFYAGSKFSDIVIPVTVPVFNIEVDPFSSFALLKVNPENNAELGAITSGVRLFLNGSLIAEDRLNRNSETGIITLIGLNSSSDYSLGHSVNGHSAAEGSIQSFTTESPQAIPNGDFSASTQTIRRTGVEVGGKYKYTLKYQCTATVSASEPDGWASVNAKTCYWGSSCINTWFQVPSTYMDNGAVVLRNVAYDHAGTKPADPGSNCWYNTNVPTFTHRAAGEIFLGSYAFDGQESRTDGIEFPSRPASLEFQYKYTPTSDDKGLAYVAVVGESGNVIATSTTALDASAEMKKITLPLSGYTFGQKAAGIRVRFASSNGDAPTVTPTGSELSMGLGTLNFGNKDLGENNYPAKATGSVLVIDNVKLNY